jgi:hypothetical protein
MYSVKVTGEGWDAEKGRYESDEAILPIQGGDGNEIRVTRVSLYCEQRKPCFLL